MTASQSCDRFSPELCSVLGARKLVLSEVIMRRTSLIEGRSYRFFSTQSNPIWMHLSISLIWASLGNRGSISSIDLPSVHNSRACKRNAHYFPNCLLRICMFSVKSIYLHTHVCMCYDLHEERAHAFFQLWSQWARHQNYMHHSWLSKSVQSSTPVWNNLWRKIQPNQIKLNEINTNERRTNMSSF